LNLESTNDKMSQKNADALQMVDTLAEEVVLAKKALE